jgi:tRNA pseudouridine38-40 synthase
VRLLLELAFKGTQYHGWQIQSHDVSVQSVIQEKLSVLTRKEISIVGCGRTDSGVHAKEYFAHFHLDANDNAPEKRSLNAILPEDIVIKNIYAVPDDFHARFDAINRKYIYKIHFHKDPFQCGDSFYMKETATLSLQKLSECAEIISGLKEFNSFVKSNSGLSEFPCTILESRWIEKDSRLEYHITANRFVRGMVRLIVGMCVNYALEKISIEQIREDLSNQQQISKSWSIAAEGLSLVEVKYPEEKVSLWERMQ